MSSRAEQAIEKLRDSGVRMTPQRHAILSYLLVSLSHPSADDIYKALAKSYPNMSVATVYNNLKVFVDTGLVRELTYGDNASRFEADMTEHYHAICEHCGKIEDFDHPPLLEVERKAVELTGFKVYGHRMEVYGLCSNCANPKH